MAKYPQVVRPGYGMVTIQEPIGGDEPALVHVNGRANGRPSPSNPNILCDTGSICSFGTGAGNGKITLVRAKVYPTNVNPDPTPPTDATPGEGIDNTHRWKVEHIPSAQSEPAGAGIVQNQLAVWLQFEGEPNDWSRQVVMFIGLSSNETFCENVG